MKYYVYIVESIDYGRHYVGMTNNLTRRLKEHDIGKRSTKSTLNKGPFRLVHAEDCRNSKEARAREIFWKSGKGRELRDKIFKTWWM